MFSRVVAGQPPVSVAPAPVNVTSVTKDAGATVSWQHNGLGVTSYTITPYVAGVAQAPTMIAAGSVTTLAGSNGGTYLQGGVTGLTNSTAYTFTVKANTSGGSSPESAASGANTPLSGLVFGDDFNGPSGGPIDPEWWVYSRCGYIAQSEIEWYLPSQVTLDGSSNLLLTAQKTSHSGVSYPSDGNTFRTQTWISGACQSNAKTWAPAAGNTMTFEVRQQICHDIAGGMWPGLFWLEGQDYLTAWKTDPFQAAQNDTGKAEIDVAEFMPGIGSDTTYRSNVYTTASWGDPFTPGPDFSAGLHVFSALWKPGVSVSFNLDGVQQASETTSVPASGAQFMLLLYLQILSGSATATQSCVIDRVRVFDQNLG